jgi:hypothetical protein
VSRIRRTFGTLLLVTALGLASLQEGGAQQPPLREEVGLRGYVLAPDGMPVAAGNVELRSRSGRIAVAIEPTGRFHLVPSLTGAHELYVLVRGFAPHRINVTVRPSRTLKLPVVRLSPPTYYRVQLTSSSGEPIPAPRFLHRSVDVTGATVLGFPGFTPEVVTNTDGATTIGPLPRGVTTLATDAPPFASLRLPDLYVTGADSLLDGGTVRLDAGAMVHADVVNATGAPVAAHLVFLDDLRPFSPLPSRQARTNANGRATFDRVGSGQYRLRTSATEYCGTRRLGVSRVVRCPAPARSPSASSSTARPSCGSCRHTDR